jgi:SAM-dependent methyltransferase
VNIYNSYWSLYQKIVGSSKIRIDEKNFIKKYISHYYRDRVNLDLLVDLGCGDGRISAGLYDIANFNKIILVDATDSVYIAKNRVSDFAIEVLCIKTHDPFGSTEGCNANVLVCSGLVNYFENQNDAIIRLLKTSPQLLFVSVTSYNFLGIVYKIINSIRVDFLHGLVASLLSCIDKKIKNKVSDGFFKKMCIGFLRIIEPLVSPRVYWLKRSEYESLFISNGFQIIDSGNFGFSRWYCLKRN